MVMPGLLATQSDKKGYTTRKKDRNTGLEKRSVPNYSIDNMVNKNKMVTTVSHSNLPQASYRIYIYSINQEVSRDDRKR